MSGVKVGAVAASPVAQYVPQGALFIGVNSINGVITLVTPATNVNGLVIRTARLRAWGAGGSALYADTSAPATYNDLTKRIITDIGNNTVIQDSIINLFIPTGRGLYYAGNATVGELTMNYDLL